jgi:hypothetical protein
VEKKAEWANEEYSADLLRFNIVHFRCEGATTTSTGSGGNPKNGTKPTTKWGTSEPRTEAG